MNQKNEKNQKQNTYTYRKYFFLSLPRDKKKSKPVKKKSKNTF